MRRDYRVSVKIPTDLNGIGDRSALQEKREKWCKEITAAFKQAAADENSKPIAMYRAYENSSRSPVEGQIPDYGLHDILRQMPNTEYFIADFSVENRPAWYAKNFYLALLKAFSETNNEFLVQSLNWGRVQEDTQAAQMVEQDLFKPWTPQ